MMASSESFPASTLQDRVLEACHATLGPIELSADLSEPLGEALVLEMIDSSQVAWIAKAIRGRGQYRSELYAYREWVPALGARAPELRLSDDELQLLLISRLSGEPVDRSNDAIRSDVFEQAGYLTRLLHDSAPAIMAEGFVSRLQERFERYAAKGIGWIPPEDISFAREQIGDLAGIGTPVTVPCHLDNQPRNWLIDRSGTVRLIDFGQTERDVWIQDTSRLYFRYWPGRADLRRAFFSGYGRSPNDSDQHFLLSYAAYSAVSTIVWAREHSDREFEKEGRAMLQQLRLHR